MYSTSGNKIVWNNNQEIKIRGVSRPGLEYLYVDLPAMIPETIRSDLQYMKSWGFNLVRLPLRDKHWFENSHYREMVHFWVERIRENDMIALLDLHNQGDSPSLEPFIIKRGINQSDAFLFWKQVSQTFGSMPDVWFELYNEPHDISPDIWWNGNEQFYGYKDILKEVRLHSSNICIIGGLDWAYEWAFLPLQSFYKEVQNQKNLVLSTHPYGYRGQPKPPDFTVSQQIPVTQFFPSYEDSFSGDCSQGITIPLVKPSAFGWNESFGFLHVSEKFPIIATEFGLDRPETALQGGWFSKELMRFFKRHEIGYVAWAWVQDRLDYPSLIDTQFQPTGLATRDARGPACSSRQNNFYEGPGKLVWTELHELKKSPETRRQLTIQKDDLQTSKFPFWTLFIVLPLAFVWRKCSKKKGFMERKEEENRSYCSTRIFSDSQLRNRSSSSLA